MKQPNEFDRRILLAVSGMSPQILTETLYAIAVNNDERGRFIPTEIHLITTATGKRQADLQLLHPETGQFHKLCSDYKLPTIKFDANYIHVIEDKEDKLLDDIKTPEQNEAAADFITHLVSAFTRDNTAALHVSIAGGRKTMGYYMGYALSLYGRPQDRLSHVLVTEKYENLKDFFYPTPLSLVIHDKENKALDAKDAEIMLAEIPFVPLRGGLPERLLKGVTSFNQSVNFVRMIETDPNIKINKDKCLLWVGDEEVKLGQLNFWFYLWLLERSTKGDFLMLPTESVTRNQLGIALVYKEDFLNFCPQTVKKDGVFARSIAAIDKGMDLNWMSGRVTLTNKSFLLAVGEFGSKPFTIKSLGSKSEKNFFILVEQFKTIFN